MSAVPTSWLSKQEIAEAIAAGRQFAHATSGRRPLQSGRYGNTPGSTLGAGLDYADSRPMAQGDDPRHINWRATARQGGTGQGGTGQAGSGQGGTGHQPLVRQFHPEFNRQRVLVLDARPPMWFASRGRLKLSQALRAALMLAAMSMDSGYEPGLLLLEESGEQWFAPGNVSARQVLGRLSALAGEQCALPAWNKASDSAPVWRLMGQLPQQLSTGAEVFVFSEQLGLFRDLEAEGGRWAPVLSLVSELARQFELQTIELLDPLDQNLPQAGLVNLRSGLVSRIWHSNKTAERGRFHSQRSQVLDAGRTLLRSGGVTHRLLETAADSVDEVLLP